MSHSVGTASGIYISPQMSETVRNGCRNFFSGFTVNYVLHQANPATAVLGGVISTVASLIDTAIRPMLTLVFGREFQETVEESLIRNVVVLSVVSAAAIVAAPLIGKKIAVDILGTLAVRIALSCFDERFVGQSTVVI